MKRVYFESYVAFEVACFVPISGVVLSHVPIFGADTSCSTTSIDCKNDIACC